MTTTCPRCGRVVEASHTDRYGLGYKAMTNGECPVSMSGTFTGTLNAGDAMQTTGTFPQLNRTDAVTRRPAPKKAGKKR